MTSLCVKKRTGGPTWRWSDSKACLDFAESWWKILHIRKVSATSAAPGLELRDELSVCVSGASCRNNSILKTTVHDCTGDAVDSWLVTGINCHKCGYFAYLLLHVLYVIQLYFCLPLYLPSAFSLFWSLVKTIGLLFHGADINLAWETKKKIWIFCGAVHRKCDP